MSPPATTRPKVALLDDDPMIRELLSEALAAAGMDVTTHARADAFEAALRLSTPDVCLVDLGLPDRDGLAVVSRLALEGGAAIIIISGRGLLQDRVTGLELGADDYVVKPFEPAEIVARVRARLRKARTSAQPRIARFGPYSADFDRFVLTGPTDGGPRDGGPRDGGPRDGGPTDGGPEAETPISGAEAEILRLFLDRPRRLLTRAEMQEALGGTAGESFDRAMDVRISRLRAKLGEDPKNPALIKTIYGAGYIFLSDVAWA